MRSTVILVISIPLLCCSVYGLDKETFLKSLNVKETVSSRCQNHLNALLEGLQSGAGWALTSKLNFLHFI